jgi:ubiquinone/menaquinone biosynthesis C-methylase UbiE
MLTAAAAGLEARGRHPFFQGVVEDYLARLGLGGAERVLDLGCGTALAARAIARRFPSGPPVAAVDISEHLLGIARRMAAEEGCADRIAFHAGDAHRLAFPDGSFDVVLMHTLLSHVASPAAVLVEAHRLLRPGGGRLVVFDGDQASLTFATDAPDGGEASDRVLQRAGAAHPRVMRAMPRLLADAGYRLLGMRSYPVTDIGRADFFRSALSSLAGQLPATGAMSARQAADLAERLRRASEGNRFFGAMTFYTYIAVRAG